MLRPYKERATWMHRRAASMLAARLVDYIEET
jgi:hypothetical protein